MTTGYTNTIKDGISFEDFVMKCARAMGACIAMRDDKMDAPIPDKFEPSDYHSKKIKEINIAIKKLGSLSSKKALRLAGEEYQKELNFNEAQIRKCIGLRKKYELMLRKVENWQPPTSEHIGFKDFMISQITDSIKFDCDNSYYLEKEPKLLASAEYISKRTNKLLKDLDYHTKENEKEIDRAEGRTLWIKQLRDSLKR